MFGGKPKPCDGCGKEFDKDQLKEKDKKSLCTGCYVAEVTKELDFSPANKRKVLLNLIEMGDKYKKPFTKGEVATMSFTGGTWNDYAQIIMNMMMIDTLLSIEEKLDKIVEVKSS